MKLRAAVGVGVLLMCLWTTTCTRQTPGNPSSDQAKQSSRAENPPPNPAPAPTAVEEAKPQAPPAPAPPPVAVEKPTPKPPVVLPAGTVLTVRTKDAISAKSSQAGQSFQAVIAQPVTAHGRTVIPAGAAVTGKIVQAKQGGKIKGGSQLALQLTTIHVQGVSYPINADQYVQEAKGKGKRTTAMGAGGAGLGAVIGGIAGGGKGAAIGAVAGGGAGVAGSAMTGNKELTIPAESVLTFTLSQPLKISSHAAPNSADESKQ